MIKSFYGYVQFVQEHQKYFSDYGFVENINDAMIFSQKGTNRGSIPIEYYIIDEQTIIFRLDNES